MPPGSYRLALLSSRCLEPSGTQICCGTSTPGFVGSVQLLVPRQILNTSALTYGERLGINSAFRPSICWSGWAPLDCRSRSGSGSSLRTASYTNCGETGAENEGYRVPVDAVILATHHVRAATSHWADRPLGACGSRAAGGGVKDRLSPSSGAFDALLTMEDGSDRPGIPSEAYDS